MNLNEIVEGLAEVYTGGKEFFDALDSALLCQDIYAKVYGMVKDPHRYTFITTGSFGINFINWIIENELEAAGWIIFPGGMRDGKCKAMIKHDLADCWTNRACFVDDSFYSGITRETCLHTLYVEKDLPSFVAYDGSLDHPPWLKSLYQWHGKEQDD